MQIDTGCRLRCTTTNEDVQAGRQYKAGDGSEHRAKGEFGTRQFWFVSEEQELIRELQRANNRAFADLVKLYGGMVLNTCYRLVLDKDDAEDIAQEVFVEVFQSISTFRGDSKLSSWLYRVAIAKSLDHIKKMKRAKRLSSFARFLKFEDVQEQVSGGIAADAQILEKEREEALRALLDTLPDNQRVAFMLSKIDGLGIVEVASIMQTSVTAVDSLIYRAKRRITERLRKILENDS